jgi:uncharacterized membrane protein YozB (DUF420 family)
MILPAVNATLNAISGVLLLIAYVHIRARRIQQHRRFMLAAFATSSLFLVCYLVYTRRWGPCRSRVRDSSAACTSRS